MGDDTPDLSVTLDGSEVADAADRVREAAEELEAALEELEQASIAMDDPLGYGTEHVDVGELFEVEASIRIGSSRGPDVVCPTCDRRVWDEELQEEFLEERR